MDLLQFLQDLVFDYTLRTVALGAGILGLISGSLGVFAVLRKQSLMGDAVSHAALPGIALAFLLTGTKAPLGLLLGAAAAGWLGMLIVFALLKTTRLNQDTVLGVVLSVFFGFGLVLLTTIQRFSGANKAGLDKYLFGQAAALLPENVWTMAVVGVVAIGVVMLFWKEFKLISFDPQFAASLGLPIRTLDILLTALIVSSIVVGLQTVGVVLMSAMLIAPAVGARQWTDRLWVMFLVAGLFGLTAGVMGAAWSSSTAKMPTGPVIVLVATGIALFSLFFAPNRGLVWATLRSRRNRSRLLIDTLMADLLRLALKHGDPTHGHEAAALQAISPLPESVPRTLGELESRRLATRDPKGLWHLTEAGVSHAKQQSAAREVTS